MTDNDQEPAAATEEEEPLPEIPAEQLELLLKVWGIAWVNGFMSAAANAAARAGLPTALRQAMAHSASHQAEHILAGAMHDPIVRTVIVERLQHIVANRPPADQDHTELTVPCVGHDHDHEGPCGV